MLGDAQTLTAGSSPERAGGSPRLPAPGYRPRPPRIGPRLPAPGQGLPAPGQGLPAPSPGDRPSAPGRPAPAIYNKKIAVWHATCTLPKTDYRLSLSLHSRCTRPVLSSPPNTPGPAYRYVRNKSPPIPPVSMLALLRNLPNAGVHPRIFELLTRRHLKLSAK